jgi:hypothetical protein
MRTGIFFKLTGIMSVSYWNILLVALTPAAHASIYLSPREQSPTWKANSGSSQKFPVFYGTIHYSVHKSPPSAPIPNQINSDGDVIVMKMSLLVWWRQYVPSKVGIYL